MNDIAKNPCPLATFDAPLSTYTAWIAQPGRKINWMREGENISTDGVNIWSGGTFEDSLKRLS